MKPLIRWAGGKAWFVDYFRYYMGPAADKPITELFAGGAALSFGVSHGGHILNDTNPGLIAFYRRLAGDDTISQPTQMTKEEYLALRMEYNELLRSGASHENLRLGELFYILNRYCFNGLYRVNKQGVFNTPFGSRTNLPRVPTGAHRERIRTCTVLCGPYHAVPVGGPSRVVFADPPYAGTFTGYSAGGFDWSDQERLVRVLNAHYESGSEVIATNSYSKRTEELYAGAGFQVDAVSSQRRIRANGDRTKTLELVAWRRHA